MVPTHPQTFSPAPAEADRLLALIADPTAGRSLTDIAAEAGVPLSVLTLWLTQPEIAARLDALEALAARRVRLIATDALPVVVHTLTTILKDYLSSVRPAGAAAPTPVASPEHAQRRDETARKAATLLVRLSRFTFGPARQRTPATTAGDERPPRLVSFSPPPGGPRVSPPSPAPHPGGAPDPARLHDTTSAEQPPQAEPPQTHRGPSPDPGSLALAILSLPPESVDLSDPETATLLQQLATLPDDTPPEEAQRLVTQLLSVTTRRREAG